MENKCLECKWLPDMENIDPKEIWHCLSCTENRESSDTNNFELKDN